MLDVILFISFDSEGQIIERGDISSGEVLPVLPEWILNTQLQMGLLNNIKLLFNEIRLRIATRMA
jgi:hypothetical protein